MKKIINLLLVISLFGLFIGCNNNPNGLSPDFTVEGLSLDNEETDGRSQYYSKINSMIVDIENHSLYPSGTYEENLGELRRFFYNGISKDDYVLEDEKSLLYSSYSHWIVSIIQSVPHIDQNTTGSTFYEEADVNYYGSVFNTFANDDYIYYYSENDEDESATFEVLVEEDNIKMNYYYESDTETRYQKNDFNQGYLSVSLRQYSSEDFSFVYEFYNYQTDQYELIEYQSYKNTLKVILGDYVNGEIIEYRKDIDSENYKITLHTNGYRDIHVNKIILDDETSFIISYNIMNISGWDYFERNTLYLNDSEVLSSYSPSMLFGFDSVRVHQSLANLNQENYNRIGDSTYNGPITFDDIQISLENAESITDNYSITYTGDDEVDTIILDSNTYSLEALSEFFEALVNDNFS